VRIAALLLTPIMPGKCREIRERLAAGVEEESLALDQAAWAPLDWRPSGTLSRPEPLFPRIDAD
jgi:methionyl-tRNA synthetase